MSAQKFSVTENMVTTEENSFISYGLRLLADDGQTHIFTDISTNFNAVEILGNRFINSDISEVHFRDIIDDFIALEADALVH